MLGFVLDEPGGFCESFCKGQEERIFVVRHLLEHRRLERLFNHRFQEHRAQVQVKAVTTILAALTAPLREHVFRSLLLRGILTSIFSGRLLRSSPCYNEVQCRAETDVFKAFYQEMELELRLEPWFLRSQVRTCSFARHGISTWAQ